MKYSFIIPMHNDGKKAVETIQSILNQEIDRGDAIEVVAVDNNSTDDSVKIIREFLGGRGRVVSEIEKQGPNAARRKGMEEATGDVLCFVDADTTIPPDWLTGVERAIREGYVAVSGPYYYNFDQLYLRAVNWLFTWLVLPVIPYVLYGIFRKKAAVVIGGNFAVTRKALEAIGGIPDVDFYGDDARIAMLLVRKVGPVAFSHRVKAFTSPRRYYRDGAKELQAKYNKAYFDEYFDRK